MDILDPHAAITLPGNCRDKFYGISYDCEEVCRHHCIDKCEDEQCVCDIIESVALVETSLSHILNAEGEKLQKAVELADNVDELLAVNKSVTKTIINIAQLEHHLYLKLDALNDLGKKPIHIHDHNQ